MTVQRDPPYQPLEATYEEFVVGETTVAMITDVVDATAWIQSDETMPVER